MFSSIIACIGIRRGLHELSRARLRRPDRPPGGPGILPPMRRVAGEVKEAGGALVSTYDEYRARKYFPVLDGLRAVAILMVFTAHPDDQRWLYRLHGGNGVTVFFVLSGFLITTLSLREEDRRGKVGLKSFFTRRFFRIAPVYFLVLGFYCYLIIVMGYQAARHDLFVHQLPYYSFGFPEQGHFFLPNPAAAPPFAGAWSIGIEEKFYLVWPIVGFAFLTGAFMRRIWLCVLAGVAAAVAPLLFHSGAYLEPYVHILIGCVVALLLHNPKTFAWAKNLARTPVFIGSLIAFALVQTTFWSDSDPRRVYALSGVITGIAMFGLVLRTRGLAQRLAWRPAVFLGEISYVFYLIHAFAINAVEDSNVNQSAAPSGVIVTLVLALPIAIIGSYVIHRTVERPMIKIGRRLGHRDDSRMHSLN
jgi:peptidoglycan/LPS O-acetylase OafA/YrhL